MQLKHVLKYRHCFASGYFIIQLGFRINIILIRIFIIILGVNNHNFFKNRFKTISISSNYKKKKSFCG